MRAPSLLGGTPREARHEERNKDVTESGTVPLAGRREWLGLVLLCLPTMLAMLDLNVVILALPRITAALRSSATQQLWITDIYGFFIAGFLVTMGRVGDRIGHKKLLLIGVGAFGVLSPVAAYSANSGMLIAIRALLGIAGATIIPMTLALIRNMFPNAKQMGTAMGVWATAMMAGISFGPAVGGLLLNSFWWGSVFMIAVPVMLVLLLLGPGLLPESRDPGPERVDGPSVALSLGTILPLVYGLTELARAGWAVLPVVAVVVGVASGWMFKRRQNRLSNPLLDLRLFAIPAIGGGLVLYLFTGGANAGIALLMVMHMQLLEGFSPLKTALWLLVPSVIMVVGIQVAMGLAKKIKPGLILMGGAIISFAGMLILTQVHAVSGFTTLIVGLCVMFFGVSAVPVLTNQMVLQTAPKEKAGSAGSLSTTSGDLGTALGIACIGSLATVFYQGHVHIPANVPSGAAAATNQSIANAVAAAHHLPPAVAANLLTAARHTFNSAFTTIAAICAVLFLALAVLDFFTLRGVPPISEVSMMPPAPHDVEGESLNASH